MLAEYAARELELAGMYDEDADYGPGEIAQCVLDLITTFAAQGHSGASADLTLTLFEKLARYQPLTPISSNPEEWMEVGSNVWQNRRKYTTFSKDGGRTWYDLDDM